MNNNKNTSKITKQSVRTIKSSSFFQNVEYLINDRYGTKIIYPNKEIYVKESTAYVVDYICLLNFTSIKSYRQGVTNIFNIKYKIPIILNNLITLVPIGNTQSYDVVWINYEEIFNLYNENKKTVIEFNSRKKLFVNISISFFEQQNHKIKLIKDYLNEIK